MHDPYSYRDLFPHINEGIVYLNHAAISPFSRHVTAQIRLYQKGRMSYSVDDFYKLSQQYCFTKEKVAHLLNTSPDRIAFVDNTSNGLNILANGLDWKVGDRILLNTMEFPSNVYPFLNLRRHGVEIDFVEDDNHTLPVERIISMVHPRTRLISISHVQYLNGYLVDLEALGAFCRDHGILLSVDAIQSAGAVPIDVQAMNIDFLASGCHKWLMAPEGIAFIYLTEELQHRITQAYVGWTSVRDFFEKMREFNLDLDPTARRYENGTLNSAGIIALGASLETLLAVGIENIRTHILRLTDLLIRELNERGIKHITPVESHKRSGIVSFRSHDATMLLKIMKERNVHVAVRGGYVRVSPHFYNVKEEIDILMECVEECMRVCVK